ncbi:MAG: GNAT family N-acetyltransferase [Thermoplasmata archaeon]|nr:GNAT family N-acetyltransferase [Thermoplasmata archaeon]
MDLKSHFQKIENFYGEYMLLEDCTVVTDNAMDGGFLIDGNEVYPFGSPAAFERTLEVIKRRKNLFFAAVGEEFVQIIEKNFPFLKRKDSFFYTVTKEQFRGKKKHECENLRREDAKTVARFWGGEERYIRSRIERYPSSGIYDGNKLVAWVGLHNLTPRIGIMGFLHVLDDYRGKGLAESVSTCLAEQIFGSGRIAGIHIWIDNEPSKNLARKLGFERRCTHSWFWHERD